MDDELKKMMEETDRADRQRHIAELKAIDTIFPDDIGAWLDILEANMKRAEQKLSADAAGDINEMMKTQLRVARKQLLMNDRDNLKISVMTLRDNWERLNINKSFYSGNTYSTQQSIKGIKGAEVRHAGKEIINEIILDFAKRKDVLGDPIPPNELWEELIGCLDERGAQPEEIDNIRNDYKFIEYRNPVTDVVQKMEYQTFRDKLTRIRKNNMAIKK